MACHPAGGKLREEIWRPVDGALQEDWSSQSECRKIFEPTFRPAGGSGASAVPRAGLTAGSREEVDCARVGAAAAEKVSSKAKRKAQCNFWSGN